MTVFAPFSLKVAWSGKSLILHVHFQVKRNLHPCSLQHPKALPTARNMDLPGIPTQVSVNDGDYRSSDPTQSDHITQTASALGKLVRSPESRHMVVRDRSLLKGRGVYKMGGRGWGKFSFTPLFFSYIHINYHWKTRRISGLICSIIKKKLQTKGGKKGGGAEKVLSMVKGLDTNSFEVVLTQVLEVFSHTEVGRKKLHPFKRGHTKFYTVSIGSFFFLFCCPPPLPINNDWSLICNCQYPEANNIEGPH